MDNLNTLPAEEDVRVARYIEVRTMLRYGLTQDCNPRDAGNLNHLRCVSNFIKEMALITMQLQPTTKDSTL